MERTLQSLSDRDPAQRGVVVEVPAGTVPAATIIGKQLRLEGGTWAIHVGRLVMLSQLGEQLAAAPSAVDPAWPFHLAILHGQGGARWLELLPVAARGTVVTRTGDYMDAGIVLAAVAPTVGVERVLLAASQLISPIVPSTVQTLATADGGGKAVHLVPVGATSARYIGPACTGIDWTDVLGVSLAVDGALGTVREVRAPLTAAAAVINGIAPGARTVMTWEVWG